MNLAFQESSNNVEQFELVMHLETAAKVLGIGTTDITFGLTEDASSDLCQQAQDVLEAAIQEKKEEIEGQRQPPCHIGPYADKICTICGLRQPD